MRDSRDYVALEPDGVPAAKALRDDGDERLPDEVVSPTEEAARLAACEGDAAIVTHHDDRAHVLHEQLVLVRSLHLRESLGCLQIRVASRPQPSRSPGEWGRRWQTSRGSLPRPC